MKKNIVLLILAVLLTCRAFGKGTEPQKLSPSGGNNSEQLLAIGKGTFSILTSEDSAYGLLPADYELAYLPKDQTVVIKYDMVLYRVKLSLRPQDVDELLTRLNKFVEWNKKAISQKVTLKKEIGKFQTKASWNLKSVFSDRYYNGDYSDVLLTFNNRNNKNVLDFKFPFYIDLDMFLPDPKPAIIVFPLVLTATEVEKLTEQLSPEALKVSIDKAKAGAEKEKSISEEFK